MSLSSQSRWLDDYIPQRYRAVFTDLFTFKDNPILLREIRRESRKKDRFMVLLFFNLFTFGMLAFITWVYYRTSPAGNLRRSDLIPVLGVHGKVLFVFYSGLHYYFVLFTVFRRTNNFFIEEYRKNSLLSLISSRMTTFQLPLQACAFPFVESVLVFLAGLPGYILLFVFQGCNWNDIFTMFVVCLLAAFRPARWLAPLFANIPVASIQKKMRSGAAKTWGEFWLAMSWFLVPFLAFRLSTLTGGNFMNAIFGPIGTLINHGRGWGFIVVSWVIVFGRFLLEPSQYYGVHLSPIVVFIPFFLWSRLLGMWETSLNLRTGDSDITSSLWDLPAYWRSRRLYGVLLPAASIGYLWPLYVSNHQIAYILENSVLDKVHSVAAVCWLLGSMGVMVSWARAREINCPLWYSGTSSVQLDAGITLAWRLKYVFLPFLQILALIIACCLLSGSNPFTLLSLTIIAKLVMASVIGSSVASVLPAGGKYYSGLLLVPFAILFPHVEKFLPYFNSISPLSLLLSMNKNSLMVVSAIADTKYTSFSFPVVCVIQLVLAGLLYFVAKRFVKPTFALKYGVPSNLTGIPIIVSPEALASLGETIQIPTVKTGDSKAEAKKQLKEYKRKLHQNSNLQPKAFVPKPDTPAANAILNWMTHRFTNAVLIKEMRVSLRGNLSAEQFKNLGIVTFLLIAYCVYDPSTVAAVLGGIVDYIFPGPRSNFSIITLGIGFVLSVIFAFISMTTPPLVCGPSISRERQKSTLGFLLTTPQSTQAIVFGKLFGNLALYIISMVLAYIVVAFLYLLSVSSCGIELLGRNLGVILLISIELAALTSTLGLAASTFIRREADAGALAVISLIVLELLTLWVYISKFVPAGTAPNSFAIWFAMHLIMTLVVSPTAWAFSIWRLNKMRFGDVPHESSAN